VTTLVRVPVGSLMDEVLDKRNAAVERAEGVFNQRELCDP
jgi:hypothetical protein